MPDKLERVLSGERLSKEELQKVFTSLLAPGCPPEIIASWLIAWRMQSETRQELAVGADLLRQHSKTVILPDKIRPLGDNCGTGGDGSQSFNISTASAIVGAAAGLHLVKHGNRGISSSCGSADLLFEAGFPEDLSCAKAIDLLVATGLTFFFAPSYHPAMAHIGPVRRSLGVRTIFNLLGPLANPVLPDYQVLGVGDASYLDPMASALQELGVGRALVVHSQDGLDEISPAAPTHARLIDQMKDQIEELVIDPADFGDIGDLSELVGGQPSLNHQILQKVLTGSGSSISSAVSLNAGALIWISGSAEDLGEGVARAKEILTSGKAKSFFDHWLQKARALYSES